MSLDQQRFPRAAAYLARLPAGIDSYPECQVRVDGRLNLRRDFSLLTREDGLPAMVRDFLVGSITKAWMPLVFRIATRRNVVIKQVAAVVVMVVVMVRLRCTKRKGAWRKLGGVQVCLSWCLLAS